MKLYFPVLLVCLASQCYAQQVVLTPYERMGCQQPQDGDMPRTEDELVQKLILLHGKKVENATGMKSYMLDKTEGRLWRVGSMDSCQVEIGSTSAIGHALICPPESSGPCKLGAVYRDSQTFRDEIGFHSEFSIEGSGGLPGVFEVKSTATFGMSYTYTKEYSKGLDLSYDFYVPPGRACVPTQVSYRQRCKGTIWQVRDDPWGWMCGELSVDFNDKHRWFTRDGESGWFQYVHHRSGHPSQLWTFHTRHGFRPASCSDVDEKVQVRTLEVIRTDGDAKASLEFDNGQSISAITCVY